MSSKSRHFCILGHGGVISNSALKRRNDGNFFNFGFCFWTYSTCSNRKTHKDFETKGNSGRELQGGMMHYSKKLSDYGVVKNL